ncbi:ABC transporter ATP-binding protein [Phenylobacterium sp. LjRoot219]|uniref:ABC transporter ATP-binding protein n=1 Tax=Phenylobacterium sp. LjRoot219 TaxID=3342283 RepID=UPI003ECE5B91
MSVLSFRDVWVEYGEKIILEKVTLDVAEGAFVSIVGPSGAGKSTFLRLVLGQEAPSRGRIYLDGEPLCPEPGPDRGVVFQRYSVFPHMTVLKNVMFGVQCRDKKRSARDEAAEMLRLVGLGDNLDAYPAALSGGMQQRLAIAQALVTHPRILLLDEPFGALDPGVKLDMHELITGLWREKGLTILMVTHDIKEAFKLGTRVIAIDKRRRDPQAPHRYGSTAVYDFPLDKPNAGIRRELEKMIRPQPAEAA